MPSHWAKTFFGNFNEQFNADKSDVETWSYYGRRKTNKNDGNIFIEILGLPVPEYTNSCMCNHFILENCIVSNGKDVAVVGNCCVKRFMPISYEQQKSMHRTKVMVRRKLRMLNKRHIAKAKDIEDTKYEKPTFGKYKRKVAWKDIPTSYIQWCLDNDVRVDETTKIYLQSRCV